MILREAFSEDSSRYPKHIEEVAQQLKEAYRQKPRVQRHFHVVQCSVNRNPSENTTVKQFSHIRRLTEEKTNNPRITDALLEEEKPLNIPRFITLSPKKTQSGVLVAL